MSDRENALSEGSGYFYSVNSPGERTKFTEEEDACLLEFIKKCPLSKGGNKLYQVAEEYGLLNRTYQSMKNRYKSVLKKMLEGELHEPNVDFSRPCFKKVYVKWSIPPQYPTPKKDFEPKPKKAKTKESEDEIVNQESVTVQIMKFLMEATGVDELRCAKALVDNNFDLRKTLASLQ